MKALIKVAGVASIALFMGAPAMADVVIEWNERGGAAGYAANVGNSVASRNMAIMHIAVFEAVNSIEPRYAPYRSRLAAEPGASPEVAAATAAHRALVRLFPAQAKEFDKAWEETLAKVADGTAKTNGIRLGERAADAMLAERASDGAAAPNPYRPFTAPGKYVPTVLPLSATWGGVRPFGLKSGDAVRPGAPYALTSAQWAKDYAEIKAIGAKASTVRSAEQTDIARFWTLTGSATYDPVVRQLAAAKGLDLLDKARLFALTAIATADAAIAIFDAKYAYGFWRPITAIRNGDIDGNDGTERDPLWEPFIPTPMHPEYPCAHCIFQGSAASVLQGLFSDVVPRFTMTSRTAPGVTRSFERLSDYVGEVVNARVYEGVHYRTSGEVGAEMGRKIGEHTVRSYLRPLR